MTATTRALRWRSRSSGTDGDLALEHLVLRVAETGISAEAVTIAGRGETAHGLRWRITLDPDWTAFRSLHVTRLGGATVALRHDGYGEWSDGEGKKRKEFAGLTDCLIEGSPFGFTALVGRLGKKADKTQSLDVVAVSVPDLALTRRSVTLTPVEAGCRWRLAFGDETVEVAVDGDRLVTTWGDRLERVTLAASDTPGEGIAQAS